MFSLAEVYDLGIRIEKNGEKFYRDALKQAWSKPIADMLKQLAEEEVKHVDFFLRRMDAIKQKRENPFLDEMGTSTLKDILGNQTFSLKDTDVSKIRSVDELVSLAIEFEKKRDWSGVLCRSCFQGHARDRCAGHLPRGRSSASLLLQAIHGSRQENRYGLPNLQTRYLR